MGPLLGPIFARGKASAQTSEAAFFQAMLDVEAALGRACAHRGLIPPAAAQAIADACHADRFDINAIGLEGAQHAQPVVALVRALRDVVGDAAAFVHHGATSQDILDTALMLVLTRALEPLCADLWAAADGLAELASAHARTPMFGRTLMQQALPVTFGWKAAGWMSELDGVAGRLNELTGRLPVQLGGPVGLLNDPGLVSAFAAELGLAAPTAAWQADRRSVVSLAAALGIAAGVIAKVAGDVILLTQSEVGELREAGEGGGSSSMAHKHNPVAAISAVACVHRAPGLVSTLMSGIAGEHERAAGVWQAEWPVLLELTSVTGSAACWVAELVRRLEVDADRMAANLGELEVLSESLNACAAVVTGALDARER